VGVEKEPFYDARHLGESNLTQNSFFSILKSFFPSLAGEKKLSFPSIKTKFDFALKYFHCDKFRKRFFSSNTRGTTL
jgi:hypothetical protein